MGFSVINHQCFGTPIPETHIWGGLHLCWKTKREDEDQTLHFELWFSREIQDPYHPISVSWSKASEVVVLPRSPLDLDNIQWHLQNKHCLKLLESLGHSPPIYWLVYKTVCKMTFNTHKATKRIQQQMVVSWNSGTPQSSICRWDFLLSTNHFGVPPWLWKPPYHSKSYPQKTLW